MDPKFLEYYNKELLHVRESFAEFASAYPKIAARLDLGSFECSDPYVERLIEGFAYMASRVQLKVDSSHSRLSNHLLETIHPSYLCPTPSMGVVQFVPDKSALTQKKRVPKGSRLKSVPLGNGQTRCEFVTSDDVELLPIQLIKVGFLSTRAELISKYPKLAESSRSAVVLTLRTLDGGPINKLRISSLRFFLAGIEDQAFKLYEYLYGGDAKAHISQGESGIVRVGADTLSNKRFSRDRAVLREQSRSHSGFRILQELFANASSFLQFEVDGLEVGLQGCEASEFELILESGHSGDGLGSFLSENNFRLFCSPIINLFTTRADRITVDQNTYEFHVVADRTRPMDLEVYSVNTVKGFAAQSSEPKHFFPLYSNSSAALAGSEDAANRYFTVTRKPRKLSSKQERLGTRSAYVGSEVFISLVDCDENPLSPELKQLSVEVDCTNRDLPLHIPIGKSDSDFHSDAGLPVSAIKVIGAISRPLNSRAIRETSWKLVNHLKLNHHLFQNEDGGSAASGLREILGLYAESDNHSHRVQIEGVLSLRTAPVSKTLIIQDNLSVVRGVETTIELDESSFDSGQFFLFGHALAEFLSSLVSVNSFADVVLVSPQRGECARWEAIPGRRESI